MQYGNSTTTSEGAEPRGAVDSATNGAAPHGDLLQNLVQFARRLQAAGVLVTPDEAVDALRAMGEIDMGDRREFYLTLRTVFTSRVEDLPIFDQVFAQFWRVEPTSDADPDMDCGESDGQEPPEGQDDESDGPAEVSLEDWNEAESSDEEQEVPGYSAEQVLRTKDFSTFSSDELEEIIRLTAKMAHPMIDVILDSRAAQQSGCGVDGDPHQINYAARK